ncbi:DUF1761 domain-containing protein [Candidatus Saccharibacteria bacterium]|nr:MAG: DUF1761 domain-containing protein [Candidatus Saccharibacteria bacterium]
MQVEVNYLAVFLAAASSMVVGSVWYAKGVFGATWAKLAKVDMGRKPKPGEMAMLLGLTFVASLVTAYVLAHVIYISNSFFGNSWLQDSVTTAFWLWLGFTAMRVLTHDLFEGRRKKLTLLTWGNELVTVLFMALVIGWLHP